METLGKLRKFIEKVENLFEDKYLCIEGNRYEVSRYGYLETPISEELLERNIVRTDVTNDGGIYILLEPEVGNTLVKEFFYTQYDKLCKKIQENLKKEDKELIGISSYVQFDENGLPYLEANSIIGDYGHIYHNRYYI